MPLYFYHRLECTKVSDVVVEDVSSYEDRLRIYFEPHPKLPWRAFEYSKLMYPPAFNPEKRLKHLCVFQIQYGTKIIVSAIKIMK